MGGHWLEFIAVSAGLPNVELLQREMDFKGPFKKQKL